MNTTMGKPIGETLREGRLRQRLSISECAKRIHVSAHYLESLEEERWNDLPSESHRLGFLRLYARFLGVYSDEMVQLYHQGKQAPPAEKTVQTPPATPIRSPEKSSWRWSTVTWQRLSLVVILGILTLWGIYHGFRRYGSDQHVDLSWLRFRPHNSRLVTPRRDIPVQHVRAKADADSWLRVADNHRLIFEGILPAGAVKEWSGPGPFRIKIGNVNAVSFYWNDQPVDIKAVAHGHVAELRLPPSTDSDKS
jgi:transcriptional regulator with XRE-family HTH domain